MGSPTAAGRVRRRKDAITLSGRQQSLYRFWVKVLNVFGRLRPPDSSAQPECAQSVLQRLDAARSPSVNRERGSALRGPSAT